jgi:hypothetical protein
MSTEPFASPAAWVSCPKCTAQVACYDVAGSRYFCCFNCRTYFEINPADTSRPARAVSGFKQALPPGPSLALGAVGTLGGYRCRLTGYQLRCEKNDKNAVWHEYQLRPAEPIAGDDPADFPLQLAEYEGHWLLIRQAWHSPRNAGSKAYQGRDWHDDDAGRDYRLWHRYRPVVRDAQGEFDWDILTDEQLNIQEYISPPYMLVSEQLARHPPHWYLAEYLEPSQVAEAFRVPVSHLPDRQGIGAAQPAPVPDWPQLRSLALLAGLLLTALQLLLVFTHPATQFEQEYFMVVEPAAGGTSQVLVSRSFELPASTALEVGLEMPNLTNHWTEITASLVNEQTGRGYEFTRSLEFYSGVEDGEAWSEGNRQTSAVLSAMPAGRYHFNLYPSVDKGTGEETLLLRTEANTPLWSNYWLVLILLMLVPLGAGLRRYLFEQSRWENSDFGPSPTN